MAFKHGSKAVLKIDISGSLTDISAYLSKTGLNQKNDVADTTTLSKTAKNYIPGLLDGTIPLEGPFDPTLDEALDAAFRAAATISFEYAPHGTGAGMPKYTGEAWVPSYEIETPVDGPASFTAELQVSDGVTRGTYSA